MKMMKALRIIAIIMFAVLINLIIMSCLFRYGPADQMKPLGEYVFGLLISPLGLMLLISALSIVVTSIKISKE